MVRASPGAKHFKERRAVYWINTVGLRNSLLVNTLSDLKNGAALCEAIFIHCGVSPSQSESAASSVAAMYQEGAGCPLLTDALTVLASKHGFVLKNCTPQQVADVVTQGDEQVILQLVMFLKQQVCGEGTCMHADVTHRSATVARTDTTVGATDNSISRHDVAQSGNHVGPQTSTRINPPSTTPATHATDDGFDPDLSAVSPALATLAPAPWSQSAVAGLSPTRACVGEGVEAHGQDELASWHDRHISAGGAAGAADGLENRIPGGNTGGRRAPGQGEEQPLCYVPASLARARAASLEELADAAWSPGPAVTPRASVRGGADAPAGVGMESAEPTLANATVAWPQGLGVNGGGSERRGDEMVDGSRGRGSEGAGSSLALNAGDRVELSVVDAGAGASGHENGSEYGADSDWEEDDDGGGGGGGANGGHDLEDGGMNSNDDGAADVDGHVAGGGNKLRDRDDPSGHAHELGSRDGPDGLSHASGIMPPHATGGDAASTSSSPSLPVATADAPTVGASFSNNFPTRPEMAMTARGTTRVILSAVPEPGMPFAGDVNAISRAGPHEGGGRPNGSVVVDGDGRASDDEDELILYEPDSASGVALAGTPYAGGALSDLSGVSLTPPRGGWAGVAASSTKMKGGGVSARGARGSRSGGRGAHRIASPGWGQGGDVSPLTRGDLRADLSRAGVDASPAERAGATLPGLTSVGEGRERSQAGGQEGRAVVGEEEETPQERRQPFPNGAAQEEPPEGEAVSIDDPASCPSGQGEVDHRAGRAAGVSPAVDPSASAAREEPARPWPGAMTTLDHLGGEARGVPDVGRSLALSSPRKASPIRVLAPQLLPAPGQVFWLTPQGTPRTAGGHKPSRSAWLVEQAGGLAQDEEHGRSIERRKRDAHSSAVERMLVSAIEHLNQDDAGARWGHPVTSAAAPLDGSEGRRSVGAMAPTQEDAARLDPLRLHKSPHWPWKERGRAPYWDVVVSPGAKIEHSSAATRGPAPRTDGCNNTNEGSRGVVRVGRAPLGLASPAGSPRGPGRRRIPAKPRVLTFVGAKVAVGRRPQGQWPSPSPVKGSGRRLRALGVLERQPWMSPRERSRGMAPEVGASRALRRVLSPSRPPLEGEDGSAGRRVTGASDTSGGGRRQSAVSQGESAATVESGEREDEAASAGPGAMSVLGGGMASPRLLAAMSGLEGGAATTGTYAHPGSSVGSVEVSQAAPQGVFLGSRGRPPGGSRARPAAIRISASVRRHAGGIQGLGPLSPRDQVQALALVESARSLDTGQANATKHRGEAGAVSSSKRRPHAAHAHTRAPSRAPFLLPLLLPVGYLREIVCPAGGGSCPCPKLSSSQVDLVLWLLSLGISLPGVKLSTERVVVELPSRAEAVCAFQNGVLLCQLVQMLEQVELRGVVPSPNIIAMAVFNLNKALEIVRAARPALPSTWLFCSEEIARGQEEPLWGLLWDLFVEYGVVIRKRRAQQRRWARRMASARTSTSSGTAAAAPASSSSTSGAHAAGETGHRRARARNAHLAGQPGPHNTSTLSTLALDEPASGLDFTRGPEGMAGDPGSGVQGLASSPVELAERSAVASSIASPRGSPSRSRQGDRGGLFACDAALLGVALSTPDGRADELVADAMLEAAVKAWLDRLHYPYPDDASTTHVPLSESPLTNGVFLCRLVGFLDDQPLEGVHQRPQHPNAVRSNFELVTRRLREHFHLPEQLPWSPQLLVQGNKHAVLQVLRFLMEKSTGREYAPPQSRPASTAASPRGGGYYSESELVAAGRKGGGLWVSTCELEYSDHERKALEESLVNWMFSHLRVVSAAKARLGYEALLPSLYNGTLLCEVVSAVIGRDITGSVMRMSLSHFAKTTNVKQACEALRRVRGMSARFLGKEERIAFGDRVAVTGLLEDLRRYADKEPAMPPYVRVGVRLRPYLGKPLPESPDPHNHPPLTSPHEGHAPLLHRYRQGRKSVAEQPRQHKHGAAQQAPPQHPPRAVTPPPLRQWGSMIDDAPIPTTASSASRSSRQSVSPRSTPVLASGTSGRDPRTKRTERGGQGGATISGRDSGAIGPASGSDEASAASAVRQDPAGSASAGVTVGGSGEHAQRQGEPGVEETVREASLRVWLKQLGVQVAQEPLAKAVREGVVLCRLVGQLQGGELAGVTWQPKSPASWLHNVRKVLEVLRQKASMPLDYLWSELDIVRGDVAVICGLLEQIRQVYKPRKRRTAGN